MLTIYSAFSPTALKPLYAEPLLKNLGVRRPMPLTTADFETGLSRALAPCFDEFTFVADVQGVRIHRKQRVQSGLYEYRAAGTLSGVGAKECYETYMDLEWRKEWDKWQGDVKTLPKAALGSNVSLEANSKNSSTDNLSSPSKEEPVYWQVKYPWPFANRDYVYLREGREMSDGKGKPAYIVLSRSDEESANMEPEKEGVVRVTDYTQTVVFWPVKDTSGQDATEIYIEYYDDPLLRIPKTLINWAASTAIPNFLSALKGAANGKSERDKRIKLMEKDKGVQQLTATIDQALTAGFRL